jgi:hypothetical protein
MYSKNKNHVIKLIHKATFFETLGCCWQYLAHAICVLVIMILMSNATDRSEVK